VSHSVLPPLCCVLFPLPPLSLLLIPRGQAISTSSPINTVPPEAAAQGTGGAREDDAADSTPPTSPRPSPCVCSLSSLCVPLRRCPLPTGRCVCPWGSLPLRVLGGLPNCLAGQASPAASSLWNPHATKRIHITSTTGDNAVLICSSHAQRRQGEGMLRAQTEQISARAHQIPLRLLRFVAADRWEAVCSVSVWHQPLCCTYRLHFSLPRVGVNVRPLADGVVVHRRRRAAAPPVRTATQSTVPSCTHQRLHLSGRVSACAAAASDVLEWSTRGGRR
jgi:hypothetical protein